MKNPQMLRSNFKFLQKKGRKIFSSLPFFLLIISCISDPSRYGRVTMHSAADSKNSFTFSVNDEFLRANSESPQDKKIPKMTEAEANLLVILLKKQNYCLDKYGTPIFTIASRQEKIYDMTFAHLIEQHYNARPIAPRMYFGQCVTK